MSENALKFSYCIGHEASVHRLDWPAFSEAAGQHADRYAQKSGGDEVLGTMIDAVRRPETDDAGFVSRKVAVLCAPAFAAGIASIARANPDYADFRDEVVMFTDRMDSTSPDDEVLKAMIEAARRPDTDDVGAVVAEVAALLYPPAGLRP